MNRVSLEIESFLAMQIAQVIYFQVWPEQCATDAIALKGFVGAVR